MSINIKFNILGTAIVIFFLLSLLTSYELSKGNHLQQLNFNHMKYNNILSENLTAYEEGLLHDLEFLRQNIILIREQPVACLKYVSMTDRIFMHIIKTADAIKLCEKDIEDANIGLRSIGQHENKDITKKQLLKNLRMSLYSFNENSNKLDQMIRKTIKALFNTLTTASVILGALVLSLFYFIMKNIKRNYAKMAHMSGEIKKLASFPEKNPHPTIELNKDLNVTYANPAFIHTFPQLPLDENFKKEVFQKSLVFANKTFQQKTAMSFEHKLNGRWYDFDYTYVELGAEELVRIFIKDITTQKNTQERFELTTKGAHIGLWDWTITTNKTHFSDEWYSLLGYHRGELPERFDTFQKLCHPDDFEQTMDSLKRHLEGKEEEYRHVFRMKHKRGHNIWILTIGKITEYSESGEAVRISGIHMDITERQQAKQALIDANAELEEFAYRTSHDLRSPIISSIALLDMIKGMIEDKKTNDAKDGLAHAKDSLEKLKTLIDDILQLTIIKRKKEDNEELSPSDIIEQSINKLSHSDGYKNIKLKKDLQYKKVLNTKRLHFTMICENMLSNAIKYQDTAKDESFIHIKTKKDNGFFVLTMQDNGLGIPKNQQKDLFHMFKRFHPKVAFGSGLGLYLMKKSADALGATLTFKDIGDGSMFTLKIPLKDKDVD